MTTRQAALAAIRTKLAALGLADVGYNTDTALSEPRPSIAVSLTFDDMADVAAFVQKLHHIYRQMGHHGPTITRMLRLDPRSTDGQWEYVSTPRIGTDGEVRIAGKITLPACDISPVQDLLDLSIAWKKSFDELLDGVD